MRGALLIGVVVVLLIIGWLVMKNMGADNPGGAQDTQAKEYLEKAKDVEGDLDSRFKDIKKANVKD